MIIEIIYLTALTFAVLCVVLGFAQILVCVEQVVCVLYHLAWRTSQLACITYVKSAILRVGVLVQVCLRLHLLVVPLVKYGAFNFLLAPC